MSDELMDFLKDTVSDAADLPEDDGTGAPAPRRRPCGWAF